ncbi:hypothetical protein NVP1207B_74 [Vibrio phage 1.207.B._10N.222.51.C2]|nr:hypothetical protein NVP1207B_74 [Vibrio phage 1.207.B._10N.222.51.C2]
MVVISDMDGSVYIMGRKSFEYLAKSATGVNEHWTLRERMTFHYFNPNGAYSAAAKANSVVKRLSKGGKLPDGWKSGVRAQTEFCTLWDADKPRKAEVETVVQRLESFAARVRGLRLTN